MALPSQTSRAETWRSSGSSGSSPLSAVTGLIRQNKPLVIGGIAVAAVVGGWFYYRSHSPAPATADTPLAGDTFLPSSPTPPVAANPTPAAARPANISMGSLNEPAPSTNKPSPDSTIDELIAQSGSKGQPGSTPTPTSSAPTAGGQPSGATPPAGATPGASAPQDLLNGPAATAPSGDTRTMIDQAAQLVQQNQPVEARKVLNDALMNPAISPEGRGALRAQIATINETLFFSPTPFKGDTLTDEHAVASGETLGRIVRKEGLPIDWRLLVRINKMPTENSLRIGQKLKIVRQPMHAVVHKNSYRMDIYAGAPATPGASAGPDGQEPGWIYIRSFSVGLGESNGTPEGSFVVRANSKLVNPKWVNPRTGEVFLPDDPKNPIGERWIGLEGVDENTRKFTGYGVHGTVDPDSIGQQKSMGCVRMAPADVEMVYEMLVDRLSTVKIVP